MQASKQIWKWWEHSVIFPLNKAWWKQSSQSLPNWAGSSSLSSAGRRKQGLVSGFCLKATLFPKGRGLVSPAVPQWRTSPRPSRGSHQVAILSIFWTTCSPLYFTAHTLWCSDYAAGECTLFTYCSWKTWKVCFLLLRCPEKPASVIATPLSHVRGVQRLGASPAPQELLQMGDCGLWKQRNRPQFWIPPQPRNSSSPVATNPSAVLLPALRFPSPPKPDWPPCQPGLHYRNDNNNTINSSWSVWDFASNALHK